ncbi:S1 family peptidase [Bradyrhizobium oligotrophicum]|uniref:S1 family peptidase n=1 Tax=Bradyrhizobium oligotrophicum TaxID=44255 RepID=UPI003EB894B5
MPPRRSKFPLHRPFEKQPATTSLSEAGLRLVADIYTDRATVLGTGIVIAGHLVVTAKHVLLDLLDAGAGSEGLTIDHHLCAVQLLPGPQYVIWDVKAALLDPIADLALLQLDGNPGRSHPDKPIAWRQPLVNPFPPAVGESVVGFGYRSSSIEVSQNDQGGPHVDLQDEPMASVGVVREIYAFRRDALLPFPCYQVSARFDGGMSGGPVFEETGALCGIICSNFEGSHLDGEPISYVSSLWPIFRLRMNFARGDGWPRDRFYFGIDLARADLVRVMDMDRLNRFFADHVDSSSQSLDR